MACKCFFNTGKTDPIQTSLCRFVMKTTDNEQRKVFINVCHSDKVSVLPCVACKLRSTCSDQPTNKERSVA